MRYTTVVHGTKMAPANDQSRLRSHADPPWSGFDCLPRIFEGLGQMAPWLVEHILTALL
jgi:hypothetical protein